MRYKTLKDRVLDIQHNYYVEYFVTSMLSNIASWCARTQVTG